VAGWRAGRRGGGWLDSRQAASQAGWLGGWVAGDKDAQDRAVKERKRGRMLTWLEAFWKAAPASPGREHGHRPRYDQQRIPAAALLPRRSKLAQASSPRAGCRARIRSRRSHSIPVWEVHRAGLPLSPGPLKTAPVPPMGPLQGPHQDPIALHHLPFWVAQAAWGRTVDGSSVDGSVSPIPLFRIPQSWLSLLG